MRRRVLTRLAFFLVILCQGAVLSAQSAGFMDRVGALEIGTGESCSATLVRGDVVLTAAHCLFDDQMKPLDRKDLWFRRDSDPLFATGVEEFAWLPAFDPSQGATADTIAHDLALVRLDYPLGDNRTLLTGDRVYPGDRVELVRSGNGDSTSCLVVNVADGLFTLDCPVSLGDSGAPVFRLSMYAPELVGIVSAFETEGSAFTAIAVDIGGKLTGLFAQLERQR